MERISSFFSHGLWTEKQNILLNTCAVLTWSLVYVLKLISTFVGQNKELFFMHVLKKDVLLLCP
jgi:hypothetical protein